MTDSDPLLIGIALGNLGQLRVNAYCSLPPAPSGLVAYLHDDQPAVDITSGADEAVTQDDDIGLDHIDVQEVYVGRRDKCVDDSPIPDPGQEVHAQEPDPGKCVG